MTITVPRENEASNETVTVFASRSITASSPSALATATMAVSLASPESS